MLLYWRARRWTRCYFDKKPRWYRSNVLSSYNIKVAARDCVSLGGKIPRRVRFSGDISRVERHVIPGREIDPDHISDLDAIRVFLRSAAFLSLRRRLTIRGRSTRVQIVVATSLRDSRRIIPKISVSTFSALIFGIYWREFIDTRWPQRYEDLLSAIFWSQWYFYVTQIISTMLTDLRRFLSWVWNLKLRFITARNNSRATHAVWKIKEMKRVRGE